MPEFPKEDHIVNDVEDEKGDAESTAKTTKMSITKRLRIRKTNGFQNNSQDYSIFSRSMKPFVLSKKDPFGRILANMKNDDCKNLYTS